MTNVDTYWALWAIITTPAITASIVIMATIVTAAVLLWEWEEEA